MLLVGQYAIAGLHIYWVSREVVVCSSDNTRMESDLVFIQMELNLFRFFFSFFCLTKIRQDTRRHKLPYLDIDIFSFFLLKVMSYVLMK